jgi:hypothetical protein
MLIAAGIVPCQQVNAKRCHHPNSKFAGKDFVLRVLGCFEFHLAATNAVRI